MLRRQPDVGLSRQRLFKPERQPVLVPAGDQRQPRRGADRRIGVTLGKADASFRDPIDIGRGAVPRPIARQVGITEVVGHYEHDVGLFHSATR